MKDRELLTFYLQDNHKFYPRRKSNGSKLVWLNMDRISRVRAERRFVSCLPLQMNTSDDVKIAQYSPALEPV